MFTFIVSRNFTRFAVISKSDFIEGPKDKSSIIYAVEDKPGALYETLKIFSEENINMVKLESRPVPNKSWRYLFYVDLEIDIRDKKNRDVIKRLEAKTGYFKVLGSYRKGSVIK